MSADCPQVETLEDFARGSVSAEMQSSIDAHLSNCDQCAARVAEVRSNLQFGARIQTAMRHTDLPNSELPQIPGYELTEEIGRGGMGVVYRGRQQEPDRPAALKLLAAGSGASDYALRLFQREANALARLRHPAIANVFDAGQATDGRRYLAMEFVEGKPLHVYLNNKQPPLSQRVRLMIEICDAVSHAHQRGVLHRDLKPANILVEADQQPKVLDFGLARISDEDSGASQITEDGRIQGTVRYMSPEQAGGQTHNIDARSDVYALGVILYEVLTGQPPYELGSGSLVERLAAIQTTPARPLRTITPSVPRDLEAITLKALEKDPALRYESVAQFRDDLHRYRTEQPVLARPQTATYQLYKFARRHRLLVTLSTAAIVALIGTTGAAVNQAMRASTAEQTAIKRQQQAETASQNALQALAAEQVARTESEAVTEFLARMLSAGDPAQKGTDVRVVEVLDDAAQELARAADTPVAVAVRLHMSLGQAYLVLSQTNKCIEHYRTASDLAEEAFGPRDARTLRARYGIARSMTLRGENEQAIPMLRDIADIQEEVLGPDHPDTLATLSRYASELMVSGDVQKRIEIGELVLERSRLNERVSVQQFSTYHRELGRAYAEAGDSQRAEQHYRAGLAVLESAGLSGQPSASSARAALGLFLKTTGRYEEAQELQQSALAAYEQAYGRNHHRPIGLCRDLGDTYNRQGDYDRAAPLLQRAANFYLERYGPDNRQTLYVQTTLVNTLAGQGKHADALRLAEQVLASRKRTLGPQHPKTLESMNNLGTLLLEQRRYREAAELLKPALAGRRQVLGPKAYNTLNTMQALGATYTKLGRLEEAEDLLETALAARMETVGPKHVRTIRVLRSLATLMKEFEDYERAEELYLQVQQLDLELLTPNHPNHLTNKNNLATLYRKMDRYEDAQRLYEEVYDARVQRYGDTHASTLIISMNLAALHFEQDNLEESARWNERALATMEAMPNGAPRRYEEPVLRRHASISEKLQRPADAIRCLTRLRDLTFEEHGQDAEETLDAQMKLVRACARLQPETAAGELQQLLELYSQAPSQVRDRSLAEEAAELAQQLGAPGLAHDWQAVQN